MAIVEFSHTVKYGGVFHAPHTSVNVKDEDIEELVALGAKVLSSKCDEPQTQDKPKAEKAAPKKPYKIPSPTAKKG